MRGGDDILTDERREELELPDDLAFAQDPLSEKDRTRIRSRVDGIIERQIAATGLSHLSRPDRESLTRLKNGGRLIQIRSEHHADELAATLRARMPWMALATTEVWQAMRQSVREGWPGLRIPPLLLDGPPGIGKSYWARRSP